MAGAMKARGIWQVALSVGLVCGCGHLDYDHQSDPLVPASTADAQAPAAEDASSDAEPRDASSDAGPRDAGGDSGDAGNPVAGDAGDAGDAAIDDCPGDPSKTVAGLCGCGVSDDNSLTWYRNLDGDGFGDSNVPDDQCTQPLGYVADSTDCNDDPTSCGADCSPVQTETIVGLNCADGYDNDCNGSTDDCWLQARFSVSPRAAEVGESFNVDASDSVDLEDSPAALEARWDWEGDGTWDTGFSTTKAASHVYSTAGVYTIRTEVRDTDSNLAQATQTVAVAAAGELLTVTTAVDEDNANSEVSLREALNQTNAGTSSVILLEGSLDILLNPDGSGLNELPRVTGDVTLIGDGTVSINGTNLPNEDVAGDCLWIRSGVFTMVGVERYNCVDDGINVWTDAGTVTLIDNYIHDVGDRGIAIYAPNAVIGPGNRLTRNVEGMSFSTDANSVRVFGNFIYANSQDGIAIATDGTSGGVIELNQIWSNGARGINAFATASSYTIRHNTVTGNAGSGLFVSPVSTLFRVLNNVFHSSGAGFGIDAELVSFTTLSHNLYFGNAAGTCRACGGQTGDVLLNPLFIDAVPADFRLQSASPAINTATDDSLDVNGALPGNFNGAAPDMGALEAP